METKNFLNNEKDPSSKELLTLETEKKLLPRLKIMAYLLMSIGLITFIYALIAPKEEAIYESFSSETEVYSGLPLITDDTPFELNPTEIFNFYLVSALFIIGGIALLFIVKKKRRFLTSYKKK